jgi:hypothetical protein
MRAVELQDEILKGHARFYSFKQWLAYLATLRLAGLRDHTWCWWLVRR